MMTTINLKKLVLQKEFSLIQEVINAIDLEASIETLEGQPLLQTAKVCDCQRDRYPIALEGQLLGWVIGNEKAGTIANLIAQLAYREHEKRTLAQELLSKYKEISLLFKLSEKIVHSLDFEEVATLVLEEAHRLLRSRSGTLLLLQDSAHMLESIASFGDDDLFQPTIPLWEGVIGNIVQVGRGEIVNDVLSDPRYQSESESKPITSLICVPLTSRELTLGAIALSRPAQQPYSAEDLKLLTTLACQAAGFLNALLHERQLIESRQNDLIFWLSSQIRYSLELDDILATAVSEIYKTLRLDRCCFLWYQSQTRLDRSASATHDRCALPQFIGGLEIVTESKRANLASLIGFYTPESVNGLAQRICQRELVSIHDVQSHSSKTTRQFLQSREFAAFLAIPLQTRSGQIGAICCGTSQEPRIWSDSEIALLQAVTNQLAIAVDQAELYEDSRTATQIAQDRAEQLGATLETLKQTQLQLVQSEKMSGIGQMVAGIAHEINNPISFIQGNLGHLQGYSEDLMRLIQVYQEECDPPSEELLEIMEEIELDFLLEDLPKTLNSMTIGTDRIREIVLSLRNFSRLDQAEFKQADIHEGINSTLLILGHRLKPRSTFPGIEIIKNYGDLPLVDCAPGQLNQVFMNILANAIDALEESTFRRQVVSAKSPGKSSQALPQPNFASPSTPIITIGTQQIEPNRIQIRIADNGPGVSEEIRAKLFDPFFTTKGVGKGTGLGLSISYQIVTERHGGSLYCQSDPSQGTEFVIEIPIHQGNHNRLE